MASSRAIQSANLAPADNFANLKISPNTIICREKTIILGDVTIGQDCVVHPTTKILATKGPIIIGGNNLIEERVVLVNNSDEPMRIGSCNVFEVDSYCEAPSVGNNNLLEAKCRVGNNITITDGCVIGAGCDLLSSGEQEPQVLEPNTIIYGKDCKRRVSRKTTEMTQSSQLDFLRKILPNYQKLWRNDTPGSGNAPVHR